jgi:O-antigen ligase
VIITLFQIGKIGLAKGIGGKTIYEVGALSGHKNILSAYLLLLFGINLWFLPAGQSKRWMFLLLSTQVILVFLLRSRTTLVAMALFITLIAVYQIFSLGARWKIIGSRIFLGIAAMGIAAMLIFTKLGGSAKDLNQLNPANFLKDASLVERLFVWSKTKTLIAEEWLSGYGAGNWKLIFPSKSISGGFRLETKDLMFTRVHNDFLEVWAELGIGGFILFLGIFLIPLFGIFYQLKHSKGPNLKLVILAGILFSYLIISFFDFPKERLEFQVMLAFILVLVVKSTPLFFKDHHFSWTLPDRTFRYAGLIAGFLLLLNAPISYFNMKGEYHTLRTMKAQTLGLWPLVEMESARAYSPIYQVSPVAISIKWYEGLALYHQGKYEKARSAFEIAIRHTPYFTRLLNDFASCLVQLQDFEGAKELYHKVMFINPKFEDGMFNLAYVYAQLKDFDKAYEWVNKTKSNIQKKEDFIREIEVLREAAQ